MAKLQWDEQGKRLYETGTSKGALNVRGAGKVVAWNGLTKVTESPEGAEETALYADNIKYLSLTSAENFKGTIEAYTYPDEFMAADGSAMIAPGVTIGQQTRKTFDLAYRTEVGNDEDGTDHGYKIHIIYNAKVAPSERAYETINDSPAAITFSWAFTTTPIQVEGFKPTSYFVFDSTKVPAATMKALEDMVYGTAEKEPKIPSPTEILELIKDITTTTTTTTTSTTTTTTTQSQG